MAPKSTREEEHPRHVIREAVAVHDGVEQAGPSIGAGLGHQVSLCFLPFNKLDQPANAFDLRRQSLNIQTVLRLAEPLLQPAPFYPSRQTITQLPRELVPAIQDLAFRDVQYIQQKEQVSRQSELYRMRLERDTQAEDQNERE